MATIEIYKDSNIVDVAVASARHENIDSKVAEDADKVIKDLFKNPNPNNKYQIAQLIGFAVNEIVRPQLNWIDLIADTKRVGFGDKAQFDVKLEGIRAFIQAKGATTERSKVGHKKLSLETISVSARPVVNIVEGQNGLVSMADLINDAAYQMNLKINQYVQGVLNASITGWGNNYYGSGSGVVKATIDPLIYHWMRMGGRAALLGDIAVISKLSALTGFDSTASALQFSGRIIDEHNQNGFISTYLGAGVVPLVNPPIDGTDDLTYDANKIYILPTAADAAMRPLKVVFEGDVFSTENTDINDLSFEVRLDQYFNAAVVYGDRPYMGVYYDNTIQ